MSIFTQRSSGLFSSTLKRCLKVDFKKKTTVSQIVTRWESLFQRHDIPEALCSAQLITAHVLGRKTLHGIDGQMLVSGDVTKKIDELCHVRLTRLPVQYVIGEWDFLQHTLVMRPPVFIPRPETEELVLLISENLQKKNVTKFKFCDIGTGSGAILISLLNLFPEARGLGVDANSEACELAEENSSFIGVKDRMILKHSILGKDKRDWLALAEMIGKFDLIVSNPPYIPTSQSSNMEPEILNYEDHRALFSGKDGMDFVKLILENVFFILKPQGWLWLEVDLSHPEKVEKYVKENDLGLCYVKTYQDFTNRSRFCCLQALPSNDT